MERLTKVLKDGVKRGPRCKCAYQGCDETIKKVAHVRPKFKVHVPVNAPMPNLAAYCAKHRIEIRNKFIWGILQPGDVAAQKGSGPIYWMLSRLMSPSTDRFHHFLLWRPLKDGDWVILESISHGISVGKLSLYNGDDVKFYRVANATPQQRQDAPEALLNYARCNYDRLLEVKLALQLVFWILPKMIFIDRKVRRIDAKYVHYRTDNAFLCTEAVQRAYCCVGFHIVPDDILPVPASFKKYGKLDLILETTQL